MGRSHTYRKPDVVSHICRKPRWGGGDPISAGNLDRGDPISAGNLDGGNPISAANLDEGWGVFRTYRKPDVGSHICRKPRWGGGGGFHIYRKP